MLRFWAQGTRSTGVIDQDGKDGEDFSSGWWKLMEERSKILICVFSYLFIHSLLIDLLLYDRSVRGKMTKTFSL